MERHNQRNIFEQNYKITTFKIFTGTYSGYSCGEGRQNVKRIIYLKKDEYFTFDFLLKSLKENDHFAFSVHNLIISFRFEIRKNLQAQLKNIFIACKEYSRK